MIHSVLRFDGRLTMGPVVWGSHSSALWELYRSGETFLRCGGKTATGISPTRGPPAGRNHQTDSRPSCTTMWNDSASDSPCSYSVCHSRTSSSLRCVCRFPRSPALIHHQSGASRGAAFDSPEAGTPFRSEAHRQHLHARRIERPRGCNRVPAGPPGAASRSMRAPCCWRPGRIHVARHRDLAADFVAAKTGAVGRQIGARYGG